MPTFIKKNKIVNSLFGLGLGIKVHSITAQLKTVGLMRHQDQVAKNFLLVCGIHRMYPYLSFFLAIKIHSRPPCESSKTKEGPN